MTFETENHDALDNEVSQQENVNRSFMDEGYSNSDDFSLKVGERTYDMESIAKKIEHLDKHVKTLEQENKEYREKISEKEKELQDLQAKSKTIEDVLKLEEEAVNKQNKLTDKDAIIAEINSRLESKLVNTIEQRELKKREEENFEKVRQAITQVYGDKTDAYVQSKAKELGLPIEEAVKLAKQSPDAFLRVFVDAKISSGSAPTTSSYNSMAINKKQSQEENKLPNLMKLKDRDKVDAYLQALNKFSSG